MLVNKINKSVAPKKILNHNGSFKTYSTATSEYRRRFMKSRFLPRPEEVDDIPIIPRERLGVDYLLNMVLNKEHNLTPSNYAYRNLHLRHLLMHSKGNLDASKSLFVESDKLSDHKIYYVKPRRNLRFNPPPQSNVISEATFTKLGRFIADEIGYSRNVYVEDGSVGSHRLGEHRVRLITNDANVNLMAKHILNPQPQSLPVDFLFESSYLSLPELPKDVDLQKYGIPTRSFTVVNLDRSVVLSGGVSSTKALKIGLAAVAGGRMLNDEVPTLSLSSHIFVNDNGQVSLVIDPNNILTSPNSKDIQGFGGAFWNYYGTFRMWNSISHSDLKAKRSRGDIVENIKDTKSAYVTQPLQSHPLQYPQPSSVVILLRDSTGILPGLAKLTPESATSYLNSGYNGNPQSSSPFYLPYPIVQSSPIAENLFQELLKFSNADSYLINVKRKDGTELNRRDVYSLLNATVDGSLKKAQSVHDPILDCSVIKSVPSVKTPIDPLHGWVESEYKKMSEKLRDTLGLTKK